jgi:hypothetical protein
VGDGRAVKVGHVVEAPEVVGFAAQAAAATVLLDAVLSIRIRMAPGMQQVWWVRIFYRSGFELFRSKILENSLALWFRFNHS